MEIKETENRQEFDEFVSRSPSVHYMKTSMWGEVMKTKGHAYHMLEFFQEGNLCGTAMVLEYHWLMHSFLYVPWGPCMDYQNPEQISQVFSLLKKYAQDHHAQFLRVDPNVIRCSRDIHGNRLENGIDNEAVTEELKSLGFTHKGYGYAYNGSFTNRYTLIIDISRSMDDILAGFDHQRITSINRHRVYQMETVCGTAADLHYLVDFEKQLTEIQGFKPNGLQYFQTIMNCFGKNAHLYLTRVDLAKMIEGIEAELSSKKYRKDPESRAAKEKELNETRERMAQYGEKVVIAAGLFLSYGDMSWDLYTYNHKAFSFQHPVDNLHTFAIQDMKNHGVKRYDMCGFSGVTSKDDPYYGLYLYKKSFGPEYIEQIGEFDAVFNSGAWKRYGLEKRAANHYRRRWNAFRYGRKKEER